VIIASVVALLAVCGALAADYTASMRSLRALQSTIDTRRSELQPLRQVADEVELYTQKKDALQKRIDVINHVQSQSRWKPELEFAERALALPGVHIDDVVIGPTVELSIRSESPRSLADTAKEVQAMTIDYQSPGEETIALHPVFAKQPTDVHWSVRLVEEKKK
jgi:Tfp pilus assembly protein PilN